MEERIEQLEEKVEFLTIIVSRLTDNQEILAKTFEDLINKLAECKVIALKE